ncbi:hypothetical protein L1987_81086 [Smallanthus sonchifolius]|uniref:Uncharacterized protein n=1 Tax=Smallanthus sonchifolius TaxID=185202 RepID=A0ACB8YQ72_9ASTR|nr:hypothetical protein L1987_81086 [Smallanthus sonchifolius]
MARQADMNKENVPAANIQKPTARVTRARAKALGLSGGLLPLHPRVKHESSQVLQRNCKRGLSDNKPADIGSSFQSKRRAVLKDVANITFNDLNMKIINEIKVQVHSSLVMLVGVTGCQTSKQTRSVVEKNAMVAQAVCVGPQVQKEKIKETEDMTKRSITELRQITAQLKLVNDLKSEPSIHYNPKALGSSLPKGEINIFNKVEAANDQPIVDIDSKHNDPQMCSLYAAELYNNLRAAELKGRPSANYMKTVQRDITQEMRGILIDWLVEVREEYKQTPETLCLTVTLIDQYLSKMYIEKQRLQLLGITCMLIASKYEETIAPRVEDFCFITDGTYTRREVLDMEREVVDVLSFHLSVPTVIKFLRRFILAAQSSYKNPTLEHYTNYKASELKATVLALQDLQLNNEATLHAIRQKYMQNKFNKVATLTSQKPVKPLS